ncbi:MAG: sigma-54-dependent Fis family transcriptional regulator [Deltaproteobacteria bacterium]|nr:sigma-54-dependent Fis family transcriptional regulator [Deltaproteobacteria bacterium]
MGNVTGRIIVVDDEAIVLKNLRRMLEKSGHAVSTCINPVKALEQIGSESFDIVISDIRMPYMDGLSFLNRVKTIAPEIEVILITGYASMDGAIEATKYGAYHYLPKPFTPEQIRQRVESALQEKRLRDEGRNTLKRSSHATAPVIIGKSPSILRINDIIRQIAPTDCNVLISGESGTGKELAARLIHAASDRGDAPFVAFNCAAFNEELVGNELFGHEKDAYTGATSKKAGLFETADGGTVFMDEIGDMPLSMQIKLLRVIQEREILRVGGTTPIPIDVRIIAATAKDLKAAADAGTFRYDLFFRLNVVNIVIPRLTERREDIPLLAYHILEKCLKKTKKKVRAISEEAMEVINNYTFPGNIRELENILEHAAAMCRSDVIHVHDLPSDLSQIKLYSYRKSHDTLLKLEELEHDYISHVLQITGGAKKITAEILGIDRASLWRKMKKYGLE